jgi:two-component sensor histidine kinase
MSKFITIRLLLSFVLASLYLTGYAQERVDKPIEELNTRIAHSKADTNRISLYIQAGYWYGDRDGHEKADLDSLMALFNRALKLSRQLRDFKWQNECLKLKGSYFLELGQFQNASAVYYRVIKNYQSKGDLAGEARAWDDFGYEIAIDVFKDADVKFRCFEHARLLYKKLGYRQKELAALKNEADIYLVEGKIDQAETGLLEVVKGYKAIGYKKLHHVYYLLAALYGRKGDLDKELYYGLEVVKSMEATNDMSSASLFYFRLGETYDDLKMPEKGMEYFRKSLKIAESHHENIYYILFQIVKLQVAAGKPDEALTLMKEKIREVPPKGIFQYNRMHQGLGSCYEAMGRYADAEKNYLEMIRYVDLGYKSTSYPLEMYLRDYMFLCEFYIKRGRFKDARRYLDFTANVSQMKVGPIVRSEIQWVQFKVDSASGHFTSAIEHFELHKRLQDSLYNEAKLKEIEELSFRYESVQKDKDIKLKSKDIQLLKKQTQLQATQAVSATRFKSLLIVIITLLSVLVIVFFNRYRSNHRNNTLLKKNQKEISEKNIELQKLLNDNEWLMKELHHRVKNNLQVIISLLNQQALFLKDEAALNAVTDSQHRIHAMSLIHQKLYKSDKVSSIYMPEFIVDLVDYLKESFKTKLDIYFCLEIDPITLDVLQAIPVGLILNELITNAIKYAFPQLNNATIWITLASQAGSTSCVLTIRDNGQGLPKNFDIDKAASYGLKLVRGLAEDLNGEFCVQSVQGTEISVKF